MPRQGEGRSRQASLKCRAGCFVSSSRCRVRFLMSFDRRHFLAAGAALALAAAPPRRSVSRPNRIAVSTYSFWQFRHKDLRDIERCIDLAAEMGFDGVEILHRQMTDE